MTTPAQGAWSVRGREAWPNPNGRRIRSPNLRDVQQSPGIPNAVIEKYMAQSLHIGLYWHHTKLPFGISAIYFDLKVPGQISIIP